MPDTSPDVSPCRAALLTWLIAAAGFLIASLCLASLTYDGSYYLLCTLQEKVPFLPHHRWLNWLILTPVVWAIPFANGPETLARLHGLLCSVVPLASLAACLAMLRGRFAPLRMWAVFGILLAPLPGQLVMVGEVTPALQAGWVGLAFVWAGCPWRWAPAVLLAGAASWGLHPVASPFFGLAAVTAAALGFASGAGERRRLFCWSAVAAVAALAKAAEVISTATAYERANIHGSAWTGEAFSGLVMTPFLPILPAFLAAALAFRAANGGAPVSARLDRRLWTAALLLGLIYGLNPYGWTGTLCYRKFGIVASFPIVALAGAEAWRLRKKGSLPARPASALLRPAALFAVTLGAMALCWAGLCGSFSRRLEACPGPVHQQEALSQVERESALNHWSTTSLSVLLQGWNPAKVHRFEAAQDGPGGLNICPGDPYTWTDSTLALSWIGHLPLQEQAKK